MKIIKQGDTVIEWYGDDIMKATEKELKIALLESAKAVQGSATKKIHSITGNLANSIDYEISDDSAIVGTNVEYGPYLEYGTGIWAEGGNGRKTPWAFPLADGTWRMTRGMKPHPFLRPALDESINGIIEAFKRAIERSIGRGGRG